MGGELNGAPKAAPTSRLVLDPGSFLLNKRHVPHILGLLLNNCNRCDFVMVTRTNEAPILARGLWTWLPWFTLVLGFVCSPSSARGSCGDYLMVGGATQPAAHQMRAQHSPENSASLPNRCSCRGPNCGQAPARQSIPEVFPRPMRLEQMSVARVACSAFPTDGEFFIAQDATPVSSVAGSEIFHPPRP